jgi:hypothetical protein
MMKYLIYISLLACSTAHAAERASLCKPDEYAVFSCNVGAKLVSLCASSDLSENAGSLFYRFGKKTHIEMVSPDNDKHPKMNFARGVTMYASGGGGDFIQFVRGLYTYIVYAEIGKGLDKEGVRVEKAGKVIAELHCKTPALVPGEGWSRVYNAKLPIVQD